MNRLRKGAVEIAPAVPMAPATTSAATPPDRQVRNPEADAWALGLSAV